MANDLMRRAALEAARVQPSTCKLCPYCRSTAPLSAAACESCGHVFASRFVVVPQDTLREGGFVWLPGRRGHQRTVFAAASYFCAVAVVFFALGVLVMTQRSEPPAAAASAPRAPAVTRAARATAVTGAPRVSATEAAPVAIAPPVEWMPPIRSGREQEPAGALPASPRRPPAPRTASPRTTAAAKSASVAAKSRRPRRVAAYRSGRRKVSSRRTTRRSVSAATLRRRANPRRSPSGSRRVRRYRAPRSANGSR